MLWFTQPGSVEFVFEVVLVKNLGVRWFHPPTARGDKDGPPSNLDFRPGRFLYDQIQNQRKKDDMYQIQNPVSEQRFVIDRIQGPGVSAAVPEANAKNLIWSSRNR